MTISFVYIDKVSKCMLLINLYTVLSLTAGPARQTRQNFDRSGNIFICARPFVLHKIACEKYFLYKVCQKFC